MSQSLSFLSPVYVASPKPIHFCSLLIIRQGKSTLDHLELVLNFEHFQQPKTCANVSDWMNDSFVAAHVKHSDLHQLSADGASNAIGSLAEYEVLSRASHPNNVDFNVCLAHQNERSGGYTSGTIKFAEPVNDELGGVLTKNHQSHVRLNWYAPRMKVYCSVRERHERKPKLSPYLAWETQWNGVFDETVRANMIMGDMCETIMELLDVVGEDRGLVTADEVSSEDYSG